MNATIRVLLADDDIIVREGLAGLLDRQNGIDVVAVAENGSEALRECSRQVVDVALLDVDMPVLDGLAAAKEMARLYPSVAVVMLTVFEHEESLAKSLALNVRGFLTKDIPSAQLAQLIKQAYAGYTVFGPRPTSILADSYLNSGRNDPRYDAFRERVERLPNHLRTTFDLLIQALPNKIDRQTTRPERGHRALLHIRDFHRTRIHQPRRTHHHRHQSRILTVRDGLRDSACS